MWRALLGRRLVLLCGALLLALGVSAYRAGEAPGGGYARVPDAPLDGPAVRDNLIAHLATRGLQVEPLDIRVVAADAGPAGFGRPFVAWFTAGREQADLYTVRGRVSETGVPVVLSEPRNLSRTGEGQELLLDARGSQVLFAVRVGGYIPSVAWLDFGHGWLPDDMALTTRVAAAASARQTYGTWEGPQRLDLLLDRPTALVVGRLTADGFTLTTDEARIIVDAERGAVAPPDAARLLREAAPGRGALELAADVLRRSDVVGAGRVMTVEKALFGVEDWLRRQQHRLFPTAADRLPVTPLIEPVAHTRHWPPPDLTVGEAGLPGEGRWQPVETQAGQHAPTAVQTFVRVDPERPYARTHLFAFDMRRLGLHFVAGSRHPRSSTGIRGSGRIDDLHRPRLVAAFDGGLRSEHGRFGAIEGGRPLVQPKRGLATVVTDAEGRAGFGLWDAETLPAPWTDLRQNLAPLIEGGVVNPREVRHWGQGVAALDETLTPRSALGLTADGLLVFGWSQAITAERLGEALRRVGVEFALHLAMSPGHTGLELYRPEGERVHALPGTPEMELPPGRWLGTDARDFFYLVRAERNPPGLILPQPAPGEGQWRAVQHSAGAAAVSAGWLTAERVGGARQVQLLLLETDRLRPHVVPGLAEIRPATGAPPAGLQLPGPPLLWIDVGLRAEVSPYGFTVAGRTWRAPQPGLMTLAADGHGGLHFGRFGAEIAEDGRWTDLIQGPALLVGGEIAEGALGGGTMPISALGRRADGRWVHATAADGDRRAVARALKLAEVVDALLLGERGTAATGSHRLYFARGDRLWVARPPTGGLQPARLAVGAGTALVFTARRPPPAARILPTFVSAVPNPAVEDPSSDVPPAP